MENKFGYYLNLTSDFIMSFDFEILTSLECLLKIFRENKKAEMEKSNEDN